MIPIFDLDGTLVDSDDALVAPFLALGVPISDITFGHVLADECDRLGISVDAYLDLYDSTAAQPFAGVEQLMGVLGRWAVCSNKHPRAGYAELERLGWQPEITMFADSFEGPKQLAPIVAAMSIEPAEVIFVGDTAHDRLCASAVGASFALAAWNPRATAQEGDIVLHEPAALIELLG